MLKLLFDPIIANYFIFYFSWIR